MYGRVIDSLVARMMRTVLWLSTSHICRTHCATLYVHVKCMQEHPVRIVRE